jgi:hypothetical protein
MHHHTSLLYTADVDRITTLDCATLRLHVCSLRVWALRFSSCCLESRFNHHCVFEGRKDLPFTIFHKGLANSYAQSSDASPKPSFGQNHTKNFTRRLPHAEGCFMTTTILMTSHFLSASLRFTGRHCLSDQIHGMRTYRGYSIAL